MAKSTRESKTRLSAVYLLAAVCMLATSPPSRAQTGGSFAPEFTLSREDSAAVLEYSRDIDAIERPDPMPFLRIFGDGRYVIHYPTYMKMAGDWQGRLAVNELDALIQAAIESGLLEFDAIAAKNERWSRETARRDSLRAADLPELFEVSDKESTRIRLELEFYKPEGVIGAGGPLDKEILWWGLREDSRLYPEFELLQNLASFEAELRALAEAPNLERLPREGK